MITTTAEPIYIELLPTATYHRRRLSWWPGDRAGDESDNRLGTLRIVQQKGRKSSSSTDVDEYGVQADSDQPPPGCVAYLVLNDTPPKEEGEKRAEVYRVVVGKLGTACDCRAGSSRKVCKHASAIEALIQRGILQ